MTDGDKVHHVPWALALLKVGQCVNDHGEGREDVWSESVAAYDSLDVFWDGGLT